MVEKGKYVIAGAKSEIGTVLADHLIKAGCELILISRSEQERSLPKNCIVLDKMDLTKSKCLSLVGETISKHFDSKFTFIHSVGDFWEHKSLCVTGFDEVKRIINSHYVTLFGMLQTVIPIMKNVGGGKIVAFSCNSVKYNYPDMAAFTSAKAAVECLIKCTANEVLKHNIIANSFALPSIKTDKVIQTKPEQFSDGYMTLKDLIDTLYKTINSMSPYTTGNTISLVKYSHLFYHKSYYDRNKIVGDDNND
jgi:NADP-dependent 3-hydroxy acid dehydrogenase YdfG